MRELTLSDIHEVSGAGFIKDGLGSLGGKLGDAGYKMVSGSIGVNIPVIGDINLGDTLPDLGKTIGTAIGEQIGGNIESSIAKIPGIGSILNGWLGN
ncbi:hypothetical protein [Enterobacter sp. CC120223-11]|uniref:hypothetical protein n=1 Tax=Enterobacter sp. CC120223-11 TaxID=1378073 RepID=UPI000BCA8068|nr:hypothetical protein [Enterobacter sp. CC120223-11]SNY65429.1 hypothetical protein SAMN02744775_01329 [Enterobacter sp. CC120223-11]